MSYQRFTPTAFKANTHEVDPAAVLERASIMQYDGELPRPEANRLAARDLDARRALDADPEAAQKYRIYISSWAPDADGDDLPCVPPCTQDNAPLWQMWWAAVEGKPHET